MKKSVFVLLAAVLLCALLCATAGAETKNVAYSKLGFALDASVVDKTLVVKAVTADGEDTFAAENLRDELLHARTSKGDERISFGTFSDIAYDANGKVVDISKLFNLGGDNVWFDTIKYGAEFTPANGKTGNVIASGWVLDKSDTTVTIGDTNHFCEVYNLADNARFFEMNIDEDTIVETSLDAMPVTEKTEGLYSLTKNRQPAIVVFDSNYENCCPCRYLAEMLPQELPPVSLTGLVIKLWRIRKLCIFHCALVVSLPHKCRGNSYLCTAVIAVSPENLIPGIKGFFIISVIVEGSSLMYYCAEGGLSEYRYSVLGRIQHKEPVAAGFHSSRSIKSAHLSRFGANNEHQVAFLIVLEDSARGPVKAVYRAVI